MSSGYATKLLDVRYGDLEEISIRQELIDFITGDDFGIDKHLPFVARVIKRNRAQQPKRCQCFDKLHGEGKIDCPICQGIGYKYDEVLIPGFIFPYKNRRSLESNMGKSQPGRNEQLNYLFITQCENQLRDLDRIYRILLTAEGFINYPIVFQSEYLVTTEDEMRLDGGRHEYNLYSLLKVR